MTECIVKGFELDQLGAELQRMVEWYGGQETKCVVNVNGARMFITKERSKVTSKEVAK